MYIYKYYNNNFIVHDCIWLLCMINKILIFQKMQIKLFTIRNLEDSDNEISSYYIKWLII